MNCSECNDLIRTFEATHTVYIHACGEAFYRVSRALAAKKEVDMERAKSALEEHRAVCPSAAAVVEATKSAD